MNFFRNLFGYGKKSGDSKEDSEKPHAPPAKPAKTPSPAPPIKKSKEIAKKPDNHGGSKPEPEKKVLIQPTTPPPVTQPVTVTPVSTAGKQLDMEKKIPGTSILPVTVAQVPTIVDSARKSDEKENAEAKTQNEENLKTHFEIIAAPVRPARSRSSTDYVNNKAKKELDVKERDKTCDSVDQTRTLE